MDEIKNQIKQFLQQVRVKFNCQKITFATNRKFRYQLEIPNEYTQDIEKDENFFLTTRLKNVKRYLCNELSNLTT